MRRSAGIAAKELETSDIKRELRHLYETREDTFFNGSADALDTHTSRMLELEKEYARRRPAEVEPSPARTREGARRRSGQKMRGQIGSRPRTRSPKRKAS